MDASQPGKLLLLGVFTFILADEMRLDKDDSKRKRMTQIHSVPM